MKPSLADKRKWLLRKRLRLILRRLKPAERRKKSRCITENLLRNSFYRRATHILVYASLPTEVSTRQIIRKSLLLKKRVYLPYILTACRSIKVYRILTPVKDLRPGSYGILEPRPLASRRLAPSKLDLVIVPGLGFDLSGGRMGRGAGYYDRFLASAVKARKIGLAFREQTVKRIPAGKHDIRMDEVITD